MRLIRHSYQSASTVTHLDQGRAVCVVQGVVTPATSAALMLDYQLDMAALDPAAAIAIYKGTALAIDAKTLLDNARRVMVKPGSVVLPTALVVDPDTADLWRDYAWLMAQQGVVRSVFTDVSAAERWAAEKAAAFRELMRAAARAPQEEAEAEARSSRR